MPDQNAEMALASQILGEFVALLGETSDVILQGSPLFLPATLQIPGIAGLHVCAQEVVGKYLIEIFPGIDRVPRQVIEPSSGHVS
jgi:hypothetical protein